MPDPNPPTPPTPDPKVDPKPDPTADLAKTVAALQAEIAALKGGKKTDEDPDLNAKAAAARAAADKDSGRIKRLENSIAFNMKSADFLKANASLLPSDVPDLLAAAEKETYADQSEKADAIKSGLVQSFFKVQENYDLLTPGQKAQLDEYLKLTKTSKQEKAQAIYDMVFEPAFEMLKRTKRAEALNKGLAHGSSADEAYKEKMRQKSMKHYGLEK